MKYEQLIDNFVEILDNSTKDKVKKVQNFAKSCYNAGFVMAMIGGILTCTGIGALTSSGYAQGLSAIFTAMLSFFGLGLMQLSRTFNRILE